ncbi:START-like domain-containing protein [Pedobacter glucosidilyticus]|uniref:START-like domain-containing protein n=1 Tax=Pedobacter glucosidilyticus TaxID=1122941 RepID=UPI0003F60139|nr:START-like domain-containing protein [Pedobacter glucosidilyticus]
MADKVKFTLEYEIKCSPKILYGFISEPNGLSQWFADDVYFKDHVYTFVWDDGEEQKAKMLSSKESKSVKFAWLDDEPYTFFELEIIKDELTNDVALVITDFALPENLKDRQLIWNIQIENLLSVIGA